MAPATSTRDNAACTTTNISLYCTGVELCPPASWAFENLEPALITNNSATNFGRFSPQSNADHVPSKQWLLSGFTGSTVLSATVSAGGTNYQVLLEFYCQQVARKVTGSAETPPQYFVGVDLGQSRDPTAIAVVRRVDHLASADAIADAAAELSAT